MAPNMISAVKRARKVSTPSKPSNHSQDSVQSEQLNSRDSLLYIPNTYVTQSLATVQKKPIKSRKGPADGTRSRPSFVPSLTSHRVTFSNQRLTRLLRGGNSRWKLFVGRREHDLHSAQSSRAEEDRGVAGLAKEIKSKGK
jgi:hypothetical protein